MKAYAVNDYDAEFWDIIVWSKNSSKAKSQALGEDSIEGARYIDLYAHRIKWADELEQLDEWSFFKERLKHEDLNLGEIYGCGLLTEKDIPNIQKYNSLTELEIAWNRNEFKTIDELENLK